jgi:hypothetical protein
MEAALSGEHATSRFQRHMNIPAPKKPRATRAPFR